MKTLFTILVILFSVSAIDAQAQDNDTPDTVWHYTMQPVEIRAERAWENDTIRYQYNQMRYYVGTILPYLDEAVVVFNKLNEIDNKNVSKRAKKNLVKKEEESLRKTFDEDIKSLNETQGVLLVKLIGRQTGVNIYHILKEHKGGVTALKWLGWAKIQGFNLNKKYDPADEPWLENIMDYYGYTLPEHYNSSSVARTK